MPTPPTHNAAADPFYIYLHGLNGSSRSVKAGLLRAALAPAPVLTPDYPAHRPRQAIAVLTALLAGDPADGRRLTLIGSSMGGFYGQYLARRFPVAHLYLINPALNADVLWRELPAATMVNGAGEPYRLTPAATAELAAYAIPDPCAAPVPTTLFLDEGDALIDYRIAAGRYQACARVCRYPGGDHAFQHLAEASAVIRAGG